MTRLVLTVVGSSVAGALGTVEVSVLHEQASGDIRIAVALAADVEIMV